MMTRFAHFLSYVFHPLLIPTYTVGILLRQEVFFILRIPENYRWQFLSLIFLSTFLLPSLIVFIYKKFGLISSMQMKNRKERTWPLISVGFIYVFTFLMIRNMHISSVFNVFAFGGSLLMFATALINLRWKISLHMTANGAMVGLFLGLAWLGLLYNPLILPTLIFANGWVGFARLKLNAHTESQVYTGFLMGTLFMFGLILFLF